jgi:hypothetical protein
MQFVPVAPLATSAAGKPAGHATLIEASDGKLVSNDQAPDFQTAVGTNV